MVLALILALQAAPPAAPPSLVAVDFDLARYRPADEDWTTLRTCSRAEPGTIIVCGRRGGGAYPLAEMARIFEPGPLRAEMGIAGNMRGDIHAESVALDRGAVSNRVMVRIRVPF
jgi:hypothetical protein